MLFCVICFKKMYLKHFFFFTFSQNILQVHFLFLYCFFGATLRIYINYCYNNINDYFIFKKYTHFFIKSADKSKVTDNE